MRIVTLNVNGIRAAEKKGLSRWLKRVEPWDVVCLQEIKATTDDVPSALLAPCRAHGFFLSAGRKGYAGVALYAKQRPKVTTGFGSTEFDGEGRYLEADFGKVAVASIYLPSGSAGPHRQASKYRFMEAFLPHLLKLRRRRREIVLCGDWNIAHQAIDLRNARANQKNSGFLPEERAWLTRVFDELGFVDVFRTLNREPGHYTFWSTRGQAWKNNVGWRIDYQVATPRIAAAARAVAIYKARRFSDHAPVIVDYDFALA